MSGIAFSERPLAAGKVYPCTVSDLRERLLELPGEDTDGLWAVGLVPETRKHRDAYATHWLGDRPVIWVYSLPADLRWRLTGNVSEGLVRRTFAVALEYGLQVDRAGRRWVCAWTAAAVQWFILDYVLPHEVGHHVYWMRRKAVGLMHEPRPRAHEEFADRYARRHARGPGG